MAGRLTESEVRGFLQAIETGSICLTTSVEPQSIYAGNVEYDSSNGWRIVIFNDCNEWDYVDAIVAPDGRRADFDDIEGWPSVSSYYPPDELIWLRYRIPGYCQFRCIACGEPFRYRKDEVYCCLTCLEAASI